MRLAKSSIAGNWHQPCCRSRACSMRSKCTHLLCSQARQAWQAARDWCQIWQCLSGSRLRSPTPGRQRIPASSRCSGLIPACGTADLAQLSASVPGYSLHGAAASPGNASRKGCAALHRYPCHLPLAPDVWLCT